VVKYDYLKEFLFLPMRGTADFTEFLQRLEQILAVLTKHENQNAERCLMQKFQDRQG
jgi:hypothetical protein